MAGANSSPDLAIARRWLAGMTRTRHVLGWSLTDASMGFVLYAGAIIAFGHVDLAAVPNMLLGLSLIAAPLVALAGLSFARFQTAWPGPEKRGPRAFHFLGPAWCGGSLAHVALTQGWKSFSFGRLVVGIIMVGVIFAGAIRSDLEASQFGSEV